MQEANNQNAEKDLVAVFPGKAGERVSISRRFFIAATGPNEGGISRVYLHGLSNDYIYVKSTPEEIAKALNI